MPVYEYTALDIRGKKLKGVLDAGNVSAARQRLRDIRVYPVEFREASERGEDFILKRLFDGLFRKISRVEVSAMTRQLSMLLAAGLPLVPSLNILVAQTVHPQLKKVLAKIKGEVNEGYSFSQSLSRCPEIFPAFYVNMVRAGEASGTINVVLERLADFSEKQQALRGRIKTALAYPVFMFVIGGAVMFFLIAFVVPNITKVFAEMRQTLPFITVALIFFSNFLKDFWWLILVFTIGSAAILHHFVTQTAKGRYFRDRMKLVFPLIGLLNRKLAVARFSRTLGTLLQSSVPLLTALEIAKNIADNILIGQVIQDAAKEVEEGKSLSSPLSRSGLFPPIATEMIAVGEQSGDMETMLFRISEAYEREVESSIAMITSVLEPAMILVMGLAVGFIVISILLPIFEMNQLVK
jgi:general secretion pathway protein F